MSIFKKKSSNLFEPTHKAKKIKALDICYPDFDISKCGNDFLKYEKLEELFVQQNIANFKLLPPEIGQLKTLRKLHILNFNYTEFPEWIFNLTNLKSLLVRGNDIEEIPSQINKLKQLKKLRIENCAIKNLPNSISELENLKQLSLSDNFKLTELNTNIFPPSLKVLNLAASGVSIEKRNEMKLKFPKLKINQFID